MPLATDVTGNGESASEIKFLIDAARADEIRAWARVRMDADPYAEVDDTYRTSTLYFDTANFDVLARRGSFGRSKYRIRRYGESDRVFLERKVRTSALVSKRRSSVPIGELDHFLERRLVDQHSAWPGGWFHRRLAIRALQPVCQISYARTARVACLNGQAVRLTIDRDICGVSIDRTAFSADAEAKQITAAMQVLELKFAMALPAQFKQLMAAFRLTPQRISKYRLTARALGLAPCPAVPDNPDD